MKSQAIIHDTKDHSLSLVDMPAPTPTASQYLINVEATTFTSGELLWAEPNALDTPIPGFDLAGTIAATPKEAPANGAPIHPIGTRVYGLTSFSRHGNATSVTVAEPSEIVAIPESMTTDVAASIPLSGLSAWQSLFTHAKLIPEKDANKGKRVLITAASGGVGIWLVQLARWSGAHVTGTCGTDNVEFVKQLGAVDVVDYKTTNIVDWVGQDSGKLFDLVMDCVGGESLKNVWTLAKSGGIVTSIAQPPDTMRPTQGVREGVGSFWFVVEPNSEQLRSLGDLVELKAVTAKIDSVWAFEDYRKAMNRVKNGHVSGKVVLKIRA